MCCFNSPESKAHIVRSSVRLSDVVRPSTFSNDHCTDLSKLSSMGNERLVMGPRWVPRPYMVKITFKILLLQNHLTYDLETRHVAYDFSTLYTTLPHNLIKDKLTELIEQTFNREGSLYLACNDKNAFFTSEQPKRYKLWSCQKMCDALHYLLDNIFIRFGSKLYRQIVGIPMGTNCAPLVADLFLFCYERDFMLSLSDNNQADIIEAFNSTSRYLDDLLNIDNPYFEQMVGQIYPTELQLNKANSSDTEAPFLDLNLSITNGIVSSKIYDKRDGFNFEIVNFPFLDGDVPRSPSYGVYISQLIRFARVCSNVDDFNNRNLF